MIAPTWELHCQQYQPGLYEQRATPSSLQRDADALERMLTNALHRMNSQRKAA